MELFISSNMHSLPQVRYESTHLFTLGFRVVGSLKSFLRKTKGYHSQAQGSQQRHYTKATL